MAADTSGTPAVALASPLRELGLRAKRASRQLATASSATKDAALEAAAIELEAAQAPILAANELDLERSEAQGAAPTVLDRLRLDPRRLAAMAAGLRAVAGLPDPVGEVVEGWVRPNGLRVRRVRVPLGVVGIVYENRPNVTSDAAALCLKSGNAAFLRGSAGALESNRAIAAALRAGIEKAGLPADAVVLVEDARRETVAEFVKLRGIIDCLVPRGGPGLVSVVLEEATVPYVVDGDGNCHVYVDASADLDMAEAIVVNAKTQRPSVCNAAETLLVHRAVATTFLPRVAAALEGVELVGDEATREVLPQVGVATEEDFAREFLALRLAVAVVDDLDGAIEHVTRYSTGHSEAIITSDLSSANRFVNEVDAAAVLVNASTRFVDGSELGLGAEIGISTQKLHARGPMGLRELTSLKYVIEGDGQVRT
ncbi:MAG: glutamate-5-semialdehyde dehydrogenase [Acidimicrobiaceae bacterium]|nr:glutamate-5-semialdehyde dehydrogenase [Acidimicrobiaceae bacterium]